MSITGLLSPLFLHRQRALKRYDTEAEQLQMQVLKRLLEGARPTEWGRMHGFESVRTYEDYARTSPVNTYEELKGYIDRMRHGEKDVLWKGRVRWFAKSSGTTADKSKFLPVSPQGLKDTHYAGGWDSVAAYLAINTKSRLFDGKAMLLGGSHAPNYNVAGSLVGDLSAILIENSNMLVNYVRVPKKSTALLSDFEEKRDLIAREAIGKNVTSISGVPSWMLSVMNRALEITGKDNAHEIWPEMEMFFHGGVAFAPYRELYRKLFPGEGMHFMETYNASEGFFGVQTDLGDEAMTLMVDYGIFYEFIPLEALDSDNPPCVPLWGVECGKNYAMVISTTSGMWRYMLGDTIRFTSTNPYKFVITGRTKSFINAFGEELIVDNAEKGLAKACAETGAQVLEYTAAPVFMDEKGKCRHQWVIEFSKPPVDIDVFANILDKTLQEVNSDYEAKRYRNITLQSLEIVVARQGLFAQWLASKGKLGGQHKVPRLSNTRKHIDEILALQ